jgi:hypothetical protein
MTSTISALEMMLLREAAEGRAGEISARVAGGGFSQQDEHRCWTLGMLASEGLLAQRPAAGDYAVWRLTRSARETLKSAAAPA